MQTRVCVTAQSFAAGALSQRCETKPTFSRSMNVCDT
jgi:hypothetical protein